MKGMIGSKMAEPQVDETAADESMEESGESFTPQQEAALEDFGMAAKAALFGDSGIAEKLAAAVKGAPEPAQALADFAYNLTGMLDEKSGGMLDEELLVPAGAEVLGQVVEVAQAAGLPVDSKVVAQATRLMMARLFKESGASDEDIGQFMSSTNPDEVGTAIEQRDGPLGQEA